jgi:hypothetical protein
MSAGQNIVGKLVREYHTADDAVGGAVPSGTVVYNPVFARISSRAPTQALLEQGLETPNIYTAILTPQSVEPLNNDLFVVTGPPNSTYYKMNFRVIGNSPASTDDPRRFVKVTLRYLETQKVQG